MSVQRGVETTVFWRGVGAGVGTTGACGPGWRHGRSIFKSCLAARTQTSFWSRGPVASDPTVERRAHELENGGFRKSQRANIFHFIRQQLRLIRHM